MAALMVGAFYNPHLGRELAEATGIDHLAMADPPAPTDETNGLVADPAKRITRAYGALGLLGLAKRVTYVIGPTGVVLASFRRIDPKSHSEGALRVLASLEVGRP